MTKAELLELLENVDDNATIMYLNYIPHWGETPENIDDVVIDTDFNRVILQ